MTTQKNNKEEKRQMFFDMQEHPDRYTDEQVEALFADDDIKAFFHDMSMARMAEQKANPRKVNVEEVWKKFVTRHPVAISDGKTSDAMTPSANNRFKIAASFIGIIFLSGITFAAIHSGMFRSLSSDDVSQVKTSQPSSGAKTALRDSTKANISEKGDSLRLKSVVFDNAKLGDVVSQLATFYHVKVEFENAEAQHVRIFFNWDKTKTLQQNLEILNAFDRIQVTYIPSDQLLKVE